MDSKFPAGLLFTEKRFMTLQRLQGGYFSYRSVRPEFSVKLSAIGTVDEAEIPFLVDMFAPRRVRSERIVKFRAVKDQRKHLSAGGLQIAPGESLLIEGTQAQDEIWASADRPGTEIRVMEVTDPSKT